MYIDLVYLLYEHILDYNARFNVFHSYNVLKIWHWGYALTLK